MGGRPRAIAVLLAVIVGVGGCGDDGDTKLAGKAASSADTSTGVGDAASEGSAVAPEAVAEATRKAADADLAAGGVGGTTPTTAFDPASHPLAPKDAAPMRYGQVQHPQKDTVPVALTVESADCAKVGSTLQVTVTSEADVDVAMIIGYSDGEGHDSQSLGTTGPEGRLVLDVPISPKAPPGDAYLLVAAGAPDGRRNHSERKLAVVKPSSSCG